jgi:hypothetical protein
LTIMLKMAPGYDPENGDWWYASAVATGTRFAKLRKAQRLYLLS